MGGRQGEIINFNDGDVIFYQGDEEAKLYKVLGGQVEIYSNYKTDHEILLSTLSKDDCFGEMACLEHCARSATAIARGRTTLISYTEDLMSLFIMHNPNFAVEIMRNLSARLRNSTNELEKMYMMLYNVSSGNSQQTDIKRYIDMHTVYEPDGKPMFMLNI